MSAAALEALLLFEEPDERRAASSLPSLLRLPRREETEATPIDKRKRERERERK